MKLSLSLTCSMLLFAFARSEKPHISKYVNLILDLRNYYSATTVIFTHPADAYGGYGDLQITHLVHTCSVMLSRHYVVSLNVHFKEIRKSLMYHHKIVQPLAIVLLPNYSAFLEFAEATKNYIMSFPVWVVLFLYEPGNNIHDYCHDPIGNPFNVAFDTQMLVLCENDEILREWYSIKGETTKVFDLARWNDTRFDFLTKLALYDRRRDMEGVVLRAVTVVDISLKQTGNYFASLYEKVLDELSQDLNFTFEIVSEVDEYGVWNEKYQTWSGVIDEIVSSRADIAIADMSMTSRRIGYVDFTLPLLISKSDLYIREPETCGVKWRSYFQTFHAHTWIATFMLIAVTPLLLCFMKICRGSQNTADFISDNFIYTWGVFCQQALTEFPKPSSLRIAYFTLFCTAILISAYYCGGMVYFLTACTRLLPFHTIDEFVEDGTYRLITIRGSSDYDEFVTSNASFQKKLLKLTKKKTELPITVGAGFAQICKDKKLAYLMLNGLRKSVEANIPCKVAGIRTERIDNLGMVLSKDNPYTGVINYHLQKFWDNGMITRLKDTRFSMESADENKAYQPVRWFNVVPIFSIHCMGIILSIVILIIENIYYRYKKKRERRRRRHLRAFYRFKQRQSLLNYHCVITEM